MLPPTPSTPTRDIKKKKRNSVSTLNTKSSCPNTSQGQGELLLNTTSPTSSLECNKTKSERSASVQNIPEEPLFDHNLRRPSETNERHITFGGHHSTSSRPENV